MYYQYAIFAVCVGISSLAAGFLLTSKKLDGVAINVLIGAGMGLVLLFNLVKEHTETKKALIELKSEIAVLKGDEGSQGEEDDLLVSTENHIRTAELVEVK